MQEEKREQEQLYPQPEEVTAWYVPHRVEGTEVVEMYVRGEDYPRRARPQPPRRRSRRGLWVFLGVLAVLVIAVGIGVAATLTADPGADTHPDGDASSIVDIFDEKDMAIPRADTDPSVRLTLHEPAEQLTPQDVYSRVAAATVMVLAEHGDGTSSVGTGVIFTEDGYIITNAHVIAGAESAAVMLLETYYYEALLVGYDIDADLAVLKAVDALGFPTAQFANSDDCRVGDTVYAIGNPLGIELQGTFTDGMISAINRSVDMDGRTVNTIQTTAALNSGNSGGPLINDRGQVVGINTLKMSTPFYDEYTATVEGLGFALPSADVAFVVNDILATGKYRGAPSFGMTVADDYYEDLGRTQITIRTVENGGGAFNAALEPGDVILAVDGVEVATVKDLQVIRRQYILEDVVTVTIRRGEEVFDAEVTLYSNRRD